MHGNERTANRGILLVEGNAGDLALTLRALRKGCRNGANAYVRKPVSLADLADVAGPLGMCWLRWNEPAPHGIPVR